LKTIKTAIIGIALILAPHLTAQTDFGSGAEIFARSFEQADRGFYEVTSSGLEENVFRQISYTNQVCTSADLMRPFEFEYTLEFQNYKTRVYEEAVIYNKDGKELFRSATGWSPEEELSDDGSELSYTIPGYAGSIRFYLADQVIETDADSVTIQLKSGYFRYLSVEGGKVTIPGWIYESEGTIIEWKDGDVFVHDISSGLRINSGIAFMSAQSTSIGGLEVHESQGLVLDLNVVPTAYSNPVYETTVSEKGFLTVYVQDYWGNTPEGLWYTPVGGGVEKSYIQSSSPGVFQVPVEQGQTIHIKLYWSDQTGKG